MIAATWIAVVAALADDRVELPAPGGEAWRHLEIPGVVESTSYEALEVDGRAVWRAESRCGASGLAVAIEDLDLERLPILSWDWRIEKGLEIEDERSKSGDDFAARVIVMFAFDSAQASLGERALHEIAETLRGETLPGRSLAYVWTSAQAPGQAWKNPYRTPTYLISRGMGASSDWRSERVDVREDYRRHWKAEPPPIVGIAILTDADNTCGEAIAYYADFRFLATDEHR